MRSSTWPRWLWAIPVLCGAAVVAGVALTTVVPAPDTTYLVLDAVVGLTCPAVGVLILSRSPRHPIGRLFCLSGAGLALQALSGGYAAYAQPHGLPGALLAAWVTNWVFFTGFGPLLLLPLLLPDGRLPSPRWRPVLVAAVAAMAVLQVMLMLRDRIWVWGHEVPSSFGFVPTDPVAEVAFGVVVTGLALSGVAALATRVTRSDNRRRLLPVFAAVVAVGLSVVADTLLPPDPPVGVWLQAAALPLFPAATAVSIFRYRLFEIEVLIRRTVVYALVTVVLLGAYLVTVATIGTLLRTGSGVLQPLAATAVVALAFAPVRDAAQRAVGRLLFGNRGDPAAALSLLGQRLESSAEPTRLLDRAAETVAHTLRLPAVAVLAADGTPVCAEGGVPADGVRLPLVVGGRVEGELRAAPRSPGEAPVGGRPGRARRPRPSARGRPRRRAARH